MFLTSISMKIKQLWELIVFPSKYYAKKYAKKYAKEYSKTNETISDDSYDYNNY